eukprot:CAMPEP_0113708706 /NCGR_PEP_ID=MMETSP0038_2-20120614/29142_1 /TAXON_ID=2898 /ORGANISM="Cryptomonas paramecium" /LENGTH=113 /DNA_ID=CAMNT_0000634465 /DNA_START=157 /DNA_END=495 /DNA_ORIENTATION=+ /assembly_acc=CAM_ASM_000170
MSITRPFSEFISASSASAREIIEASKDATRSLDTNVALVLGNEACDLDSAASALLMAYTLSSASAFCAQMNLAGYSVIPVLNVDRQELALRQDCLELLRRVNVRPDDVACLPE